MYTPVLFGTSGRAWVFAETLSPFAPWGAANDDWFGSGVTVSEAGVALSLVVALAFFDPVRALDVATVAELAARISGADVSTEFVGVVTVDGSSRVT